jgi:hypothetical protein
MRNHSKNHFKSDPIIGQGERTAVKLLVKLFPDDMIATQVPFKQLLSKVYQADIGHRALLETLDIVVFREDDYPIVVRIQDDRHKTKAFGILDDRQRTELEASDCYVVDVFKYEAPALFKEKNIKQAEIELKALLVDYI